MTVPCGTLRFIGFLVGLGSNRFPDFDRLRSVSAYFFKNLQKELEDLKKLPPKNKKDS